MKGPVVGYLVAAAVVLGVVIPFLLTSSVPDWNTGKISSIYFDEVLVIPADYAFAIWGPIYLGFLGFAALQLLPGYRNNPRVVATRPWFVVSTLLNGAWLFIFAARNFPLSLLLIVAMLVTALVMHRTLEIGRTRVYGLERYARLPFSLYAGWLTLATVVNATGVLTNLNWGGWGLGDTTWAVIMLLTASAIGLFARFAWRDPVYGAVFVLLPGVADAVHLRRRSAAPKPL